MKWKQTGSHEMLRFPHLYSCAKQAEGKSFPFSMVGSSLLMVGQAKFPRTFIKRMKSVQSSER